MVQQIESTSEGEAAYCEFIEDKEVSDNESIGFACMKNTNGYDIRDSAGVEGIAKQDITDFAN